MQTAWTMACFAADIYFRKRGVKLVGFQMVTLLEIGRMALSAHRIPVLCHTCPMHGITGGYPFVRRIGWWYKEPFLL